jgi:eukaryotic-like serine/threonine-protein kinase
MPRNNSAEHRSKPEINYMPLTLGTRVGPYEITGTLGAGGMGEVYRATDANLGRSVAIKVLPEVFATDPERLARFEREAKTLASLNHPNIAQIFGLERSAGTQALVMELVDGETLATRIARGPIPIDEALPIAKQIAEALEAAHEQGIIHRDLKPANIKVRPDGTVKVLDFGLAKALAPLGIKPPAAGHASLSPTITSPAMMTGVGMLLGTAAYMSPEQAKGHQADKRSDIWAFGCVLFEMLAARRPFDGEDVSDTLANVLKVEPDWSLFPADTPPAIRTLVQSCLIKDRRRRVADISTALFVLDKGPSLTPAVDTPLVSPLPGSSLWRRVTTLTAGAMVTAAVGGALVWFVLLFRPVPPAPEIRFEINTPPTTDPASLAISPDGQKIVFVADAESRPRLWLRLLNSVVARPMIGTDGVRTAPFWSPDSRSVGFFADGKLKRSDINGGSAQVLTNASGTGGAWNREGVILFTMLGTPIFRVSDTGGERVPVTQLGRQQGTHFAPQFLPDGRHFLYSVRGSSDVAGIYVGQLGSTESRRLLDADPGATYASSGQLLFVRQGTLFAQRFDPVGLELTGNPFPVAERVASGVQGAGVSVSGAGSIAYRTSSGSAQRQFVWFDRSGKEISRVGDSAGSLSYPSLSRDGERVVLYRAVNGNVDIWFLETRRGVFSRFTADVADDVMPIGSPDGNHIIFSSNRKGVHDLYQKSATTGGSEELLLSTAQPKFATDWSPDSRFVLFNSEDPTRSNDIWALPLDRNGQSFPVVQTNFDEQQAQFSPDGKWIAYQSNESGRVEIYVQPFPGPGNKWPISTNGGSQVRWRRDGKELFYVSLDGRLMAVPIRIATNAAPPEVGTPVMLFTPSLGSAVQQADYRHQYMVSSDGLRFLVATVTEGANLPITVILNWKPRP